LISNSGKKIKLLAATVLTAGGFAGMAHAQAQAQAQTETPAPQSKFQVYGYFDLGLVKETGSATRLDRGQNNWLGFKGSEALDSDLSAVFNLQMRFNPDTGTQEKSTRVFQGETTIGLVSKSLGSLRLGRSLTPLWGQKWVFDPWYDSGLMGSMASYNGDFNSDGLPTADFNNYSRASNAVYYSSPNIGGFELHVEAEIERAVGDDAAATMARARSKGASLNYANGPFKAMLAHEENHLADKISYVASSYQLGALNLMGSYSHTDLAGSAQKLRSMLVAATYAVGADTVRVGYGRIQESGNHKVSLGYNHPLSKRTNLYADVYRERLVASRNGVALGLNHSF
jgi:predicted porin